MVAIAPENSNSNCTDLVDPDAGALSTLAPVFDDPDLQAQLVSAIIGDADWLVYASKHINPKGFTDKGNAALVRIAFSCFEKYGKVPPVAVLRAEMFPLIDTTPPSGFSFLGGLVTDGVRGQHCSEGTLLHP
jgi:hypothetical protein